MSRVIDEEEVFATTSTVNEARDPTEVLKFFVLCMQSLCQLFGVQVRKPSKDEKKKDEDKSAEEIEQEKEAAEKEEKFCEYISRLYDTVVVKGKNFKKDLPVFSKTRKVKDNEAEAEETDELDLKGKSVKYKVNGSIWIAVIKGSEDDKNVRSSFKKMPASTVSTSVVPIVTVKLFQAILSLMCARRGIKGLTPAPLFASIFSACKDKKCAENDWAYHGHAGINFVANYVRSISEPKKTGESDKEYKHRVAWKNTLPPIHHLLAAAYKLDSNKKVDKDSKKSKAQLELEKYSTVRAIVQTCQITDVASYLKLISPKDWGSAALSGTSSVVNSFVKGMMTKEKVSKKKKKSKKNQDEESEESEEEESEDEEEKMYY